MILVQKPLTLTPVHIHRRHPSAPPTVVVQPTRTPGLLTLSKPPRPPLSQRQNQRQTPKSLPKSKSTPVVPAPLLNSPAEITDTKKSGVIAVPATPSPQPRGRGQSKQLKDQAQIQSRSPSQPLVRGKHGRQPSPPIPQPQSQQIPSQAEVAVVSFINLSDPFLDNDSSFSSNLPSSTIPFNPSGKSVNRRQERHTPSPSPTPSEAIPVPAATRRQMPNMSRSDPIPSYIRQRPRPISARPSTFQHFPICDDMNDVVDAGPTTPPATHRHYENGLHTAPIATRAPGTFPFNAMGLHSPSPVASKRGNRKHRRTPSEGVFHMSSDEDVSSGPDGTVLNPNVKALFGLVNTFNPGSKVSSTFSTPIRSIPPYKRDSASPSNGSRLSKEKQLEREAIEKAAGYFASSMYQNSPSPDELPDPLLF
ncbi:hypothetical protein BYT27DRAFT_7199698 [Phlegmacium glaucopus]|nr:hypothetical protein BYT27DRAFT_7199698 [Phlegmacium glaucopus]